MKKTGLVAAILLLCVLSGCAQYSKKEESEQVKYGKKLMQDYLTAYVPGGKVTEAYAHTEQMVGQGTMRYLSDYVSGTYKDADGTWKFEVNTETGKLYSSKYFDQLKDMIKQKILDKLDLGEGAEVSKFWINYTALPHHCKEFGHDDDEFEFFGEPQEWGYSKYETIVFPDVLPIAMVDIEGFLNREDRQTLYVRACEISLPPGRNAPDLPDDSFPMSWDGIQVNEIMFAADAASPGNGTEISGDKTADAASAQTITEKKPPVIKVEDIVDDTYSGMNFIVTYSRVSVEGDGYEELAGMLEDISNGLEEYVLACAEDFADDLRERWETWDEEERKNSSSSFDRTIQVERADTQIVSLSVNQYVYLSGAAHPVSYTDSININAQTGYQLNLVGIFEEDEEYDAMYGDVREELAQIADKQGLYEDYEESLYLYFYGEEYELTWFYMEDEISFVFNQYALAPYASGPIYVDIPLKGYQLAELDAPEAGTDGEMMEVHVSDVGGLFENIDSNRRIYLAPGVYDLSEWMDTVPALPDNPKITYSWDNIVIKRVKNLEILAESRMPAQIVIQDAYADVLCFEKCENLVLQGLTLGHAVAPGSCTGDVLEFQKCKGITLREMDLYGCGAYGISASSCEGLTMTESWIHDCTYGIMWMVGCTDFNFKDSMFTYCKEYTLLDGSASEARFENCTFDKNEGDFLPNPGYYDEPSRYEFIDCKFLSGEDACFELYRDYVKIK